MKKVIKFLIIFGIVSPIYASNLTSKDWGIIINLAGKQRMLTQKMSKEVALAYLGLDKQTNLKNLKATAGLFNTTLDGLKYGNSSMGIKAVDNKRVAKQLDKVDALWQPFFTAIKSITSNNLTSSAIEYVEQNNLKLLNQMNRAVQLYEKEAKRSGLKIDPSIAATINLAGRQRMLTQKMTKELMFILKDINPEDYRYSLKVTTSVFDTTLVGLKQGDKLLGLNQSRNTAANQQLDKVTYLWNEIKPIYTKATRNDKLSQDEIAKVVKDNISLLKEMNKAVKIFEESIES